MGSLFYMDGDVMRSSRELGHIKRKMQTARDHLNDSIERIIDLETHSIKIINDSECLLALQQIEMTINRGKATRNAIGGNFGGGKDIYTEAFKNIKKIESYIRNK